MEGFEPSYDGIKTRCLTTWRHPNSQIFPLPRDRSAARRSCRGERSSPRATNPRHSGRQTVERRVRCSRDLANRREHAAAGARQSRPAPLGEPGQRPAHFRTAPGHHRLAIVVSTCLQEAANCRLGGFPCQFRSLKHVGGADPDPRKDDGEVPFGQFQRRQALPDTLAPGGLPRTKRGISAPSSRPSSRERDGASRKPQISLRATRVVAASELPPPRPPCTGMRFVSRMSTPRSRCRPPAGAAPPAGTGPPRPAPRPARRRAGSRHPRAA